jgi:hypothetical protein
MKYCFIMPKSHKIQDLKNHKTITEAFILRELHSHSCGSTV